MIRVSNILDDIGLTYKDVGKNHIVSCWFHKENKPSMAIHKETGVFYCFSCKRSGNLFSFLKQHLDIVGIEALKYLSKFYDVKKDAAEKRIRSFKEETIKPRSKCNLTARYIVEMPKYSPFRFHPYLAKRGITTKEIQEWGMGLVDNVQPIKKFEGYRNWILIPIYQNKILRNYFLRSPFGSGKIYGTYSMKDIVFGYDHANDFSKPLYIVEGIFDAIMLRRTGVQVIESLTNRLFEEKYNLLKPYSKIIIVPDNDEPGLGLILDALVLVKDKSVKVCNVPYGKKDTGECNLEELYQVINSERDIIEYITEINYVKKIGKVNRF